ncbi:conserved hypothetical protein [Talaromyces marneffei ATCC 18224]|uniref:DUF1772 domain protein n=1 Tax=Talaromyces marneffei (strain ATCC 18224 / CBS 334.59 / QM 7333) TaxID=441960 RepID=B6QJH2_TALMQ|nr:conserved hypothetical protein [Talaromyces marneffei ATCC 18224]
MSTIGLQATAVVTGSFLSGAMMSLSLFAVRMYHYGHMVPPTMAVGTFLLYSYTAIKKRRAKQPWRHWLIVGLTTLTMVPFTWLVMAPINNRLFGLQKGSLAEPTVVTIAEAKELVIKWSRMHMTRSFMPLAGSVMGAMWIFTK